MGDQQIGKNLEAISTRLGSLEQARRSDGKWLMALGGIGLLMLTSAVSGTVWVVNSVNANGERARQTEELLHRHEDMIGHPVLTRQVNEHESELRVIRHSLASQATLLEKMDQNITSIQRTVNRRTR